MIIGTPYALDEFDTDPNRLGYYFDIGKYEVDITFPFRNDIKCLQIN